MSYHDEEDARILAQLDFEDGLGRNLPRTDYTARGIAYNKEFDRLEWAHKGRLSMPIFMGPFEFNVHYGGTK